LLLHCGGKCKADAPPKAKADQTLAQHALRGTGRSVKLVS